jgi:hypothetical protein
MPIVKAWIVPVAIFALTTTTSSQASILSSGMRVMHPQRDWRATAQPVTPGETSASAQAWFEGGDKVHPAATSIAFALPSTIIRHAPARVPSLSSSYAQESPSASGEEALRLDAFEAPPRTKPVRLSTAPADQAGNRIEAIELSPATGTTPEQGCTVDGAWCVAVAVAQRDHGPVLRVYTPHRENGTDRRYDLPHDADGADDVIFGLWPRLVRLSNIQDGVFVGVIETRTTMYSGGGATTSRLTLLHVASGSTDDLQQILSVPLSGSASIRACFSEMDVSDRGGACHDEYSFTGELTLDRSLSVGPPRFHYATIATTFPGQVTRSADSLAKGPLKKSDLMKSGDPQCSYRRTFSAQVGQWTYAPDRPLPDCSDYTTP